MGLLLGLETSDRRQRTGILFLPIVFGLERLPSMTMLVIHSTAVTAPQSSILLGELKECNQKAGRKTRVL